MSYWLEGTVLLCASGVMAAVFIKKFREYRSLLIGGGVLLVITALYPRPGNRLVESLFGATVDALPLPVEVFGVIWWIVGAWLVRSVLALILRRTLFPNDSQPHARRLFADLASGFVYVVAFVGIMDTVLKQPISTVLATSGVVAIVLGLALQSTLADLFAGLAINIERPFGAGDWITVNNLAEGQVIEIDWRATRIKTTSNDVVVMPNSVIAKAVVTNHRRLSDPLWRSVAVSIDHAVSPARVMEALQTAARGARGVASGVPPIAYARGILDSFVQYDLCFVIDDFANALQIQSEVIKALVDELNRVGISIGSSPLDLRTIPLRADPLTKPPTSVPMAARFARDLSAREI